MGNNPAERARSEGRSSEDGSPSAPTPKAAPRFTAQMYSVVHTLSLNGIDVRRCLEAWLGASAANGARPPQDLSPLAAMVDERAAQACLDAAGMTGEVECRAFGRDFTPKEMAILRSLIAAFPPPNRRALSREFCQRIGWFKPHGELTDKNGLDYHAAHAQRRLDRPTAAKVAKSAVEPFNCFFAVFADEHAGDAADELLVRHYVVLPRGRTALGRLAGSLRTATGAPSDRLRSTPGDRQALGGRASSQVSALR